MATFYSKRNQVYPVIWEDKVCVEKYFIEYEDWKHEKSLYEELNGHLPLLSVIHAEPHKLITQYVSGPTLLEVLEQQEKSGFSRAPWEALVIWLKQCAALSGQLPEEGNLRNFLWNEREQQVIGLDFESYKYQEMPVYGARLIAAILEYRPSNTAVKKTVGKYIAEEFHVSEKEIQIEANNLRERRSRREETRFKFQQMTGIVLAGGESRRMGQPKEGLMLLNKPLLLWQVEKLRELGVNDILLSGQKCSKIQGTRIVPDEYLGRGPLGGLHACLKEAKYSQCLVLCVDMPLIPCSVLAKLCKAHIGGVTVLRHNKKQEPLIGVYDRSIAEKIPQLIKEGGAPVRALASVSAWNCFDYYGPEELLQNCNTMQDYQKTIDVARKLNACGLL